MIFFNFHHHQKEVHQGIYNLNFLENPVSQMFSAGIHPLQSTENSQDALVWLHNCATSKYCVAIGECGLDGRLTITDSQQEWAFEQQILLANQVQKPLIIHCVKRFSQLKKLAKIAQTPIIIHGFNKRKTIGEDLLSNGFYLSFGKSLLDNVNLQHFFSETPLERVFLETDNAHCSIDELYLKAAEIKNISLQELTNTLEKNLKSINVID